MKDKMKPDAHDDQTSQHHQRTDSLIEQITQRLQQAFLTQAIQVSDESHQHLGHSGHKGGRHLTVTIKASPLLSTLPRLAAHRAVYDILADLIPFPIHALQIRLG